MKSLVFAAVAALAVTSYAATPAAATPSPSAKTKAQATSRSARPKLTKEEREKRIMEKVGGFIVIEAKGSIAVVNAQKAFDMNGLTNAIRLISHNLQVPVTQKEATFDVTSARKTLDTLGATAGVFIIDNPAYPMSLSSTEARWGVVNVAALRDGSPSPEQLAKRVSKEFNRVLMFVFGGGFSSMKTSIMKPILTPADLDRVVNVWTPFDTLGVVMNNLSGFGIVRTQRTTYRKACMEGWAPAPTNDFQKVIWEQVHAKPTKPMKIEFDPKKGE